MKYTETTTTSLVVAALKARDDFMNQRMLMSATSRNRNQVSAALHHLRKMQVVDVIVQPDGVGWYFLLPEELDQRIKSVDERTPEKGPRKRAKKPSPLLGRKKALDPNKKI